MGGGRPNGEVPCAVAVRGDDWVRVVARPGTTAGVMTPAGERLLAAPGSGTWADETVGAPLAVVLARAPAPGFAPDPPRATTPELPLLRGVVLADAVTWWMGSAGPAHHRPPEHHRPLELHRPLEHHRSSDHHRSSEHRRPAGQGTARGTLTFSTGQTVPVCGTVRIGRAPSAHRVPLDRLPLPLRVGADSPVISRNHVEVRWQDGQTVAVDLRSRNGTVVALPGCTPRSLEPERPFPLRSGAVVSLSPEVSFVYREPGLRDGQDG
ncbi:MAG: hypothetical protein QG608_446 [Actinomycetota bacterium]|nr:hypothetical protein [Actinomycetota bacterium]